MTTHMNHNGFHGFFFWTHTPHKLYCLMTQYALEHNGSALIFLSQIQKILAIRPSSQVAEMEGPTQGSCLLFLSENSMIFWLSVDGRICVFNYKLCLFCSLDFTALLVDIIGNSTSYLTEIFKSTSILSGSHIPLKLFIVLFVWFTPGMETSIEVHIKACCSYSAAFFLQSMDCSLLRETKYI